ncbi:MAG: hypothetical protein QXF41_00720 [Candidatus Micrarchaeaceae archaeon]
MAKTKRVSASPFSRYTLRWAPGGKLTTAQYALFAIQMAVVILLSWLGTVATPVVGPGIGFLYWAYPFFVVFTLWWGIWGIIGAWLGCVVGSGLLTGLPIIPSLAFSLGDFLPALLIFLLYRGYLAKHNVDPLGRDILSNKVAAAWFIFWVVGITNIIGGMWGVWVLVQLNFVPANAYWLGAGLWILGDAIVLIIAPFLSKYLTPIVERYGLVNQGWFS